ncbi:MAG TPA: hypothetical protein EYP57_09625 [Thermodesulfobacteriaceae bacterium]|nr:hypothetical protein [Thermodesulfobacteriaceae bacterium]
MTDLPTEQDIFSDWTPPEISESAAEWLLSRLSGQSFFHFIQAVLLDSRGQALLSGFRISRESVRKKGVRQTLTAILVPYLVSSTNTLKALFYVSFPHARWFRWAEILGVFDEEWLVSCWRSLVRGTGDPALAVGLMLDHRARIVKRGERVMKTSGIWSGTMTASADSLPDEWVEFVSMVESGSARPGPAEQENIQEIMAARDELAGKLARSEQKRQKLARVRSKLETIREKLEDRLKTRDLEISRLRSLIRAKDGEIVHLEAHLDELVNTRVSGLCRELWGLEGQEAELDKDALLGTVDDLLDRAENALRTQKKLDARYGTRSAANDTISRLEKRYDQVRKALADSLVPSQALLRAGEDLQAEIFRWKQLLPEGDSTASPVSELILDKARGFEVSEEGLGNLEDLKNQLSRSLPASLLTREERDFLANALGRLIEKRRKILQVSLAADHAPAVHKLSAEPATIANLSAFVSGHRDMCASSLLVIDGYNAIKSSAEWAALDQKDFTRARNRFIGLCRKRSGDWKRIELIFDGIEEHLHMEEMGRLTVVYTDARSRSQRADLYIKARMEEFRRDSPDDKLFLITADRELKKNVAAWCDYYIEPRWGLIRYLSAR